METERPDKPLYTIPQLVLELTAIVVPSHLAQPPRLGYLSGKVPLKVYVIPKCAQAELALCSDC